MDVTVKVGQQAVFSCEYKGTTDLSIWSINNSYYVTNFPPRHVRQSFSIVIDDIIEVDNGTIYQCIVFDKISRVGKLTVQSKL